MRYYIHKDGCEHRETFKRLWSSSGRRERGERWRAELHELSRIPACWQLWVSFELQTQSKFISPTISFFYPEVKFPPFPAPRTFPNPELRLIATEMRKTQIRALIFITSVANHRVPLDISHMLIMEPSNNQNTDLLQNSFYFENSGFVKNEVQVEYKNLGSLNM